MKESSKPNKFTRESIIGLGEDSFRKNYYPEMQSKILDLEKKVAVNKAILNLIPDIIMTSDQKGYITPFLTQNDRKKDLLMSLMRNRELMQTLKTLVASALEEGQMKTHYFHLAHEGNTCTMEARINTSDYEDVLILIRDVSQLKQ